MGICVYIYIYIYIYNTHMYTHVYTYANMQPQAPTSPLRVLPGPAVPSHDVHHFELFARPPRLSKHRMRTHASLAIGQPTFCCNLSWGDL